MALGATNSRRKMTRIDIDMLVWNDLNGKVVVVSSGCRFIGKLG